MEAQSTILLIEDDASCQEIYASVLRYMGYRVFQARTGSEGLKLALLEMPNLIILDVGLPDIDGFEVMRRLGADERTLSIPYLIATVHTNDEFRSKAAEWSALEYLAKPLPLDTLLGAIRKALPNSGTAIVAPLNPLTESAAILDRRKLSRS